MKTTIKNIVLLLYSLLLLPIYLFSQGQPFFSENWNKHGGETAMFYRNATTTDNQRNIYVAGATINGNGNHDILIQKLNPRGDLIWEATYNGYANMDDASADIFVDNQLNVYVTGTTIKNPTNAQDLIVLKYDKTGTLKWEYIYDNNGNSYGIDVGTAITGDNDGSLYVTGSSFGTNTQADYVTLRLNSDNGTKIWERRYDYLGLNEIPAKIVVKGDDLYVSGASQVSQNTWELATLFYKASDGVLLSSRRSVGNATHGVNEITDITLDNDGNIYLSGAVQNTNSYDIAVYKLDEELNILWEVHYDAYGEDDKGNGIKVDGQGNVYIAGTISTPNEGKNFVLLKYNSSGILQWEREFNGKENGNDEAAQLTLHNDYIYITGLAKNSPRYSFQTLVYKSIGDLYTQAEYTNVNENEKPTGITTDLSGDIIIVGQTELSNGNYRARTIKYSLYEKPFEPIFENGEPKYNANEVIIRFDRSAVNYSAIDRKGFIAGQLDDFVKPNVITELNNKLGMNVARFPTYKIFRRMTTDDTLSITRLGDTIKVDDFWATLSVIFPKNIEIKEVIDSLKTIDYSILHYAHTNRIIEQASVEPKDEYYLSQFSLFSEGTDNHINIEQAWEIEVGQPYVKVGVFDDPVNWRHLDFGDGTFHGSKIKGGWNYKQNTPLDAIPSSMPNNHGTAVAGIIGALRNNVYPEVPEIGIGIAGIAGGDGLNQNTGVDLYSAGIFYTKHFSTIADASEAIVEGSIESADPNTKMGFGLHLQNHSWGYRKDSLLLDSINVLRDAVTEAWRNHSIFIACRHNHGHSGNPIVYPACYQDEMVISVGASGPDGRYKSIGNGDLWNAHDKRWASGYGEDVDLIAPGVTDIVLTTVYVDDPAPKPLVYEDCFAYPAYSTSKYQCFNGTSASAPHVTGVAALMYSRHNLLSTPAAPNNLTTEDIENIIEKTAKDITGGPFNYQPGYDEFNGHGLLDAGEAVHQIDYPKYYVKHSDINTAPTVTLAQSDLNVELMQEINGMSPGNYIADLYKYEWNYQNDVLNPSGEKIIDWWPVLAGTYKGVSASTNITGEPFMDVTPSVNIGSTTSSVNAVTYAWFVTFNVTQGASENKWIAGEARNHNPSSLRFMYSIHVKNESLLSVGEEKIEPEVNLYPNPTQQSLTISFNGVLKHPKVEIFNLEGRLIKSIDNKTNINKLMVDVSSLSNGVYLLRLEDKEKAITKKFIKQ